MNRMMISKKAYAKINLCLDVLGTRDDGYHMVDMIMQQIDLHDDITIEAYGCAAGGQEPDIRLAIDDMRKVSAGSSVIPADENNLMYRAARLMIKKYGISSHISMSLIKRIPSEAGLGGGSADAAAVITGLNELFKLNAPLDELLRLGAGLGADIPFCIMGKTARAEGIGTDMTELLSLAAYHSENAAALIPAYVLLIKPQMSASTPKIYAAYDKAALEHGDRIKHPDTSRLSEAINSSDAALVRQSLIANNINVLEHAVAEAVPAGFVDSIKERLVHLGAATASMTGSGSVIYGLFDIEEKMLLAKEAFADEALTSYITSIYTARFSDS